MFVGYFSFALEGTMRIGYFVVFIMFYYINIFLNCFIMFYILERKRILSAVMVPKMKSIRVMVQKL